MDPSPPFQNVDLFPPLQYAYEEKKKVDLSPPLRYVYQGHERVRGVKLLIPLSEEINIG